jgi:replicative DNA helicase
MSNTVGEDKHELFELACEMYRDYASNLYVYECDNTGVNDIKDNIVEFIKHTHKAGRRLSIVVDYVQVIADADEIIDTDGHSAAMNIVELKRISREFNIPVIAISSEYNDSIKNSSDVMLVLRANKEEGTTEIESMKKEPRELTMIVDKNRNGEVGEEIKLNYYSKYNLFEVKGK